MRARVPALLIFAALSVVAWSLGHDVLFLVTYGANAGAILARTGHDSRWNETVAATMLLGASLAAAAAWRLGRLRREVAERRASGGLGRRVPLDVPVVSAARLWAGCFSASTALLVLQENLEHAASGLPLPWLGVLHSVEYPWTLPVMALVSFAVAVIAALFRARIATLRALLTANPRGRAGRGQARRLPRPAPYLALGSLLGRRLAGRAPPPAG